MKKWQPTLLAILLIYLITCAACFYYVANFNNASRCALKHDLNACEEINKQCQIKACFAQPTPLPLPDLIKRFFISPVVIFLPL